DLVPAGEMMLDREARMEAERLTLDVEIEIIAKTLARFGAKPVAVGLCRAEQTEAHPQLPSRAQCWRTTCRLHPLRAARNRHHPGARHLDQPERQHQADEALDLFGGAGDLEDEALGAGVDDARAEGIGKTQRLDA